MGELDSLLLINSGDILTESILVLWIFFFFFFYSFVNKRLCVHTKSYRLPQPIEGKYCIEIRDLKAGSVGLTKITSS